MGIICGSLHGMMDWMIDGLIMQPSWENTHLVMMRELKNWLVITNIGGKKKNNTGLFCNECRDWCQRTCILKSAWRPSQPQFIRLKHWIVSTQVNQALEEMAGTTCLILHTAETGMLWTLWQVLIEHRQSNFSCNFWQSLVSSVTNSHLFV